MKFKSAYCRLSLVLTLVFICSVNGDKFYAWKNKGLEVDLDITHGLKNLLKEAKRKVISFSEWTSPKLRSLLNGGGWEAPIRSHPNSWQPERPKHSLMSHYGPPPNHGGSGGHKDGGGYNLQMDFNFGWNGEQKGWKSPPSVQQNHNDHNYGNHPDDGWGWKPEVHEGWGGWGTEPPAPRCPDNITVFSFATRDDIPPNFIVSTKRNPLPSEAISRDELPLMFNAVTATENTRLSALQPLWTDTRVISRLSPDGTYDITSSDTKLGSGPSQPEFSGDNTFRISATLYQSPNMTAPINGSSSVAFQQGIELRRQQFNGHVHPFKSQVDELARLWRDIQNEERRNRNSAPGQPLAVFSIQRFSLPEPASEEKSILDAAFNFGPQSYAPTFPTESVDEITSDWKSSRRAASQPNGNSLPVNSMGEFNNYVTSHLRVLNEYDREIGSEAEAMSRGLFKQYQFFILDPSNNCSTPIDPHVATDGRSLGSMKGRFNPNAPARRRPS